MATRSTIAMVREDGSVSKAYCHWDGYLEHNGHLLVKYYNTFEKVEELLSYGDISSLGQEVGTNHPFSPWESEDKDNDRWEQLYGNMTTFYGRDRGELNTQARVFEDIAEYEATQMEEFNYLFIEGQWYYKSYDGLVRNVEEQLAANALKKETV